VRLSLKGHGSGCTREVEAYRSSSPSPSSMSDPISLHSAVEKVMSIPEEASIHRGLAGSTHGTASSVFLLNRCILEASISTETLSPMAHSKSGGTMPL